MRRSIADLPEGLRTRLLELTRGATPPPAHRVFSLEGWGLKVLGLLVGFGAAGGFTARAFTYNYPLTMFDGKLHAFATFAGFVVAFGAIASAIGFVRSRMRPATIRVPGLVARTGRDADPVELLFLQHEPLHPEYARWVAELNGKPEAYTSNAYLAKALVVLVLAALVTGVVVPVSWILNVRRTDEREFGWTVERGKTSKDVKRYADWQQWFVRVPGFVRAQTQLDEHLAAAKDKLDDVTFAEAKGARELREYRKEFPQGKHLADAKDALHEVYVEVEAAYAAQARRSGADARAAEGMAALLGFLKESDDPTVRITFLPVQGLEGGPIEKAAAEKTGSKNVATIGPSFTAQRNKLREARIARGMQTAFLRVFPGDVFQLDPDSKKTTGPRFLVRYKVLGSGAIFTWKSEEKLAMSERHVYPGIYLAFDFTLQVPSLDAELPDDPEKGYHYFMIAKPAPNFSVAARGSGLPDATAVYDVMAETAFNQFEHSLAQAYGIGAGVAAEAPETK